MNDNPLDPYTHIAQLARIFESLQVEWVLGGSLASSIVGEPRSTVDIDLATNLTSVDGQQLAERLGDDYYIDADSILDAIAHKRSFNVIHYSSAIKIDVFILGNTVLDQRQLTGRTEVQVERMDGSFIKVWIGAPIDQALRKLHWYHQGGEISDRQWHDVISILATQRVALDRDEFVTVASSLGLADLAQRAVEAAGPIES